MAENQHVRDLPRPTKRGKRSKCRRSVVNSDMFKTLVRSSMSSLSQCVELWMDISTQGPFIMRFVVIGSPQRLSHSLSDAVAVAREHAQLRVNPHPSRLGGS